jgi:hypothetical protein
MIRLVTWLVRNGLPISLCLDVSAPIEAPLALDRFGTVIFGGMDAEVLVR